MTELVPVPEDRYLPTTAATEVLERETRLLDPWLGNYPSARTREAYKADAEHWFEYCVRVGIDVLRPRPGHITAWRVERIEKGDAESTASRRVSSVLGFYRWARHEELTDADPTPFRRPQVRRDEVDILGLTREEFRTVYRNAGSPRNTAFVALLGRCGLRVSEALEANITSIREQSGHRVIRVVGKGDKPRTVPVPPSTWRPMASYLGDRESGPIFLTRTGARWQRRDAWETVKAIGKRIGMPDLHPHVLRHTAATLMLESGAPLDRVQLVMGHASPETTMRYARARNRLDGSAVYDLERYLSED